MQGHINTQCGLLNRQASIIFTLVTVKLPILVRANFI